MPVYSSSPDVPDALHAVVPDVRTLLDAVGCSRACPVGTDVRGMVVALSEGRYADAYRFARSRNPFASTCGRVCDAPCQASCLRAGLDEPVQIRLLERFVCELYGPESVQRADFSLSCSALYGFGSQSCTVGRVAIIGAGPAGLTAAHDLTLLGHRCEVFEGSERAGGRLAALPPRLLHPSVLDAEIAAILSLGITLHLSSQVDPIAWPGLLEEGFDAVIVATGGGESPSPLPGLFAAGNLVLGPSPFVNTIADGSRVAREVHRFLTGVHLEQQHTIVLIPVEGRDRVRRRSRPGKAAVRPPVVDLPAAGQVEVSLPEADVVAEAGRCVDCHRSAVIDGTMCTACGVCVDICPEDALSLVPESKVAFAEKAPSARGLSVLLKDADRCTRCGWCSVACPEGAITMQVLEAARDILTREIQE
ncbi:MAG: hypothetical protein KatS3mg024_0258 [Armatimonadota bacterium]|nr:MAG: hypothetical protein KatS3mg024_0258 [Armatimonadota bacterium]